MKVLGVDTSAKSLSVAVISDDRLLYESTYTQGSTHARHLMPAIHMAFQQLEMTISDLDGFSVSIGPGSFTGIRIGLSTVKGLAFANQKPLVGVSSLAAMAYGIMDTERLLCPLMDARRNEVYFARYKRMQEGLETICPASVGDIETALDKIQAPALFIGDGIRPFRKKIENRLGELATFMNPLNDSLDARNVAALGLAEMNRPDGSAMDDLVPLYIRKSQAEINYELGRI